MISAAARTNPRSLPMSARLINLIDRQVSLLVIRLNAHRVGMTGDLEVFDDEVRHAVRDPLRGEVADAEGAAGHFIRHGEVPNDVLSEPARLDGDEDQRLRPL